MFENVLRASMVLQRWIILSILVFVPCFFFIKEWGKVNCSRPFFSDAVSDGTTHKKGINRYNQVVSLLGDFDIPRLKGCIFSHPYYSHVFVFWFSLAGLGRQGVELSTASLFFTSSFQVGGILPTFPGDAHTFLPGQFSNRESFPFSSGVTHRIGYAFTP